MIQDVGDPHDQQFLRGHDAEVCAIAASSGGELLASGQVASTEHPVRHRGPRRPGAAGPAVTKHPRAGRATAEGRRPRHCLGRHRAPQRARVGGPARARVGAGVLPGRQVSGSQRQLGRLHRVGHAGGGARSEPADGAQGDHHHVGPRRRPRPATQVHGLRHQRQLRRRRHARVRATRAAVRAVHAGLPAADHRPLPRLHHGARCAVHQPPPLQPLRAPSLTHAAPRA